MRGGDRDLLNMYAFDSTATFLLQCFDMSTPFCQILLLRSMKQQLNSKGMLGFSHLQPLFFCVSCKNSKSVLSSV